jgi:hypothetical protein
VPYGHTAIGDPGALDAALDERGQVDCVVLPLGMAAEAAQARHVIDEPAFRCVSRVMRRITSPARTLS